VTQDEGHPAAVCLMGPTAAGKTDVAVRLVDAFGFEIISVDSALVYRGMDVGTAKPDAAVLKRAPHRLLDIREPEESYSAGDFVRDARCEMESIRAAGRVPLLVGGTMMYFRALTEGLASLPPADEALRRQLDEEASAAGWPAMHRRLAAVDPAAAARIDANDRQRIQRALEVYLASGRPLSEWHARHSESAREESRRFLKIGLLPEPRATLHSRVEARFNDMLERGFVDEVRQLRARPGLNARSPSMRAVGYRQLWGYLDSDYGLQEAVERALAATRQLAKRQITWLRSEPDVRIFNPLEAQSFDAISSILEREVSTNRGV
jgi:tRNA dimethylallyltransferase